MGRVMSAAGMVEIIRGKRYNTDTATLIADNAYWDGSNFDRSGRNTFLYRTPKGAYFAAHLTCWRGEQSHLEPLTETEARELYEELREKRVEYTLAFDGVTVEDA